MIRDATSVVIDYEVPEDFNMASLLVDKHVAEGRGDRVAIYYRDETITYRDLQRRVNKAGNMLRDRGIEIENRIILLMADKPQFIETYVGAMKIGAVPVPINVASTPEQVAYYVSDSRATAVVVDEELLPRLGLDINDFQYLKQVVVVGDGVAPSPTSSPRGGGGVGPYAAAFDAASDATASKLPFSYGLVNGLYQPLLAGVATVLVSEPSNATVVAETVRRYRPTIVFSVPTLYNLILREKETGQLDPDFLSVRMCVSAGEALPAAIWDRWLETFGLELLDGIGSTEFGYIYIQSLPGQCRAGATGRVLPGYEAEIRDEEGDLLPDGESGELYMKSESFAAYYWKKRDKTRDTFRGPWLKTGDRYRRDGDGYYYYEGRMDDMIKVGAQWVSPFEVEGALLRHAAVAECAVVGCDDADGLTKPKAYVVLKGGHAPGEDLVRALQDHSKAELDPHFYKYPRWIEFTGALPKTPTGKIQRFKLRG